MAIRVICPGCQGAMNLADELAGKSIRCKKCQTVCRVPNPAQTKTAGPTTASAPQTPAPARTKAAAPVAAPTSRKARPEEPDRPARDKKAPAGKSKLGLILGLGAGCGFLVLCVLGVGVFLAIGAFKSKDAKPLGGPVAVVSTSSTNEPVNNAPPKELTPDPKPPVEPPKNDEPTPVVVPPVDKTPPPITRPVEPLGGRDPLPVKPPVDKTPPANTDPPQPPIGPKKVVKKLPGTITNLAVGGGGRYLILHLAREHKLAIFDVKEARVARYITLTDDNVKFTAGQDKIVMVLPDTNVVQRWDIAKGERDLAVPLALKGTVKSVCMGSASQGPIFVGVDDGPFPKASFLNLRSLKPEPIKMPERGIGLSDLGFVRASADGKTFTTWSPNTSPQGVNVLVLTGGELRASYQHESAGHLDLDRTAR